MFRKLLGLGRKSPGAANGKDRTRPPLPAEFESLKTMAMTHTQALTNAHSASWGFGSEQRWDVDLAGGVITFVFEDKLVRAPVQLIGTYSDKEGTFLWGWDHPSAPAGTATAAQAVKTHADTHAIEELQSSKLAFETADAVWSVAAIAVLAGDLQGIYRGLAAPGVYAFLGFGEVTIRKREH